MQTTDLTPVVEAVITLLAVVCTTFVVPFIKQKMDATKLAELEKWVTVAVKMAEQLAKSGVIKKEERKQKALEFLADRGYSVDDDRIKGLLEALVGDLPPFSQTNTSPDEEDVTDDEEVVEL